MEKDNVFVVMNFGQFSRSVPVTFKRILDSRASKCGHILTFVVIFFDTFHTSPGQIYLETHFSFQFFFFFRRILL